MNQISSESNSLSEIAEFYASQLDLAPLPLYGVKLDGSCQCGREQCPAIGKHPVGLDWSKRATTDVTEVRQRFANHIGNIGIALQGRYVLIDADGDVGVKTVDNWPEMPETLTALSGSGKGGHWVYRLSDTQDANKITDRRFAEGVDVKVRGQFVCAPSTHASGRRYEWVRLQKPAELPDWLYQLVCKRETVAQPPTVTNQPSASRLRAYVAKMDDAVSGQGGHDRTYAVACRIVSEGLSEPDEWAIFTWYNDNKCHPRWSESELRHKLQDARRNANNTPLASRPRLLVSVPEDGPNDAWKATLLFENTKSGATRLVKCAENASIILQYDPAWAGKVRLDEFKQRVSVIDPPWTEWQRGQVGRAEWTDSDTTRLQGWLTRQHGMHVAISDCERAVQIAAERSAYSSARDWFDSLQWDGQARVDQWLSAYLGCVDDPYTQAVGRWWLISAVARVYQPGCKVDHMLILYGDQGRGKSSAAAILAGDDWFADSSFNIGDKDAYLALRGKLIVEMAELESLNRSESTNIKSFLTSRIDSYRPPYGKRNVDVPRQCVFLGTTNNHDMLRDDSGDRRFWPVTVGDIDRSGLKRDREQIWAEVVRMYKDGALWYPLTPDDRALCEQAQSTHKSRHPWEDLISEWVEHGQHTRVTLQDVFKGALSMSAGTWKHGDIITLSGCMKRLGWEQRRDRAISGSPGRYYVRCGSGEVE